MPVGGLKSTASGSHLSSTVISERRKWILRISLGTPGASLHVMSISVGMTGDLAGGSSSDEASMGR